MAETYAKNKKAYFDYEILKSYEAGLELKGHEVKSVKSGKVSLAGAYVIIREEEARLVGATISPYQALNTPSDYDEKRSRRLILHKKEIEELAGYADQKGLTIVPLKLYNKGGLIKIEIAVVRGKKKHDKREKIKEKEAKKKIERTLKKQIRG